MTDDTKEGWAQWVHRVLGDIERIDENNKALNRKMNELCVKLAILETKAAVMGGLNRTDQRTEEDGQSGLLACERYGEINNG